jgi:hypothetical protein
VTEAEEIVRLTKLLVAREAKIRELEEMLFRCVRRGFNLRGALAYYTDVPGPAQDALDRDRET